MVKYNLPIKFPTLRERRGTALSNGNKKRGDAFEDIDGFWELDALLPPKATPSPRPADVEAVEVSLGDGDKRRGEGMERYVSGDLNGPASSVGEAASERSRSGVGAAESKTKYPPITSSYTSRGGRKIDYESWLQRRRDGAGSVASGDRGDEVFEYVPENPLIFRVKVIRRRDFDGIEERSLSDMRMLAEATADFTENVEFTALFPQYSRMTDAQKRCYIGFRTEALNGRYPEVSESYVLFLLYEIINLPERFPPTEAIRLICALMCAYKNCSDSLFTFMCDWLADMCLINRINAPFELLEPVRERVYKRATWKEFFVPFSSETSEPDACVLLSSASDYDYRMGKFYTADTAEYFETHIPKAIGAVIRRISVSSPVFSGEERDVTTLSHDAFRSAFRSARCRYTVSIDCACFTRSPLLRQTVTYLVKYAENFVREMLGIRAKLSVSCLAMEKKEIVKEYFEPFIKRENDRPPLKRGRKKKITADAPAPPAPEYEKYYEPQSEAFSPELAAKIESESWRTTDMLISAFGEDDAYGTSDTDDTACEERRQDESSDAVNPKENDEALPETVAVTPIVQSGCGGAVRLTSSGVEKTGLRLLLSGKSSEFTAFARENGLLPDTLAEQINALALDVYGDIAVENDGSIDGFYIIEDYRDELTEIVDG